VLNEPVLKVGLLRVIWYKRLFDAVGKCVALLLPKVGVYVDSDEFGAEIAVQQGPVYECHPHLTIARPCKPIYQTLWPSEIELQLTMSVQHIRKHERDGVIRCEQHFIAALRYAEAGELSCNFRQYFFLQRSWYFASMYKHRNQQLA
jgi:hypothetical protein